MANSERFDFSFAGETFSFRICENSDILVWAENDSIDYSDCSLLDYADFMKDIKEDLKNLEKNPSVNPLFSDLFPEEPSEDFYVLLFNDNSHKVVTSEDSDYLVEVLNDLEKFEIKNITRITFEANCL